MNKRYLSFIFILSLLCVKTASADTNVGGTISTNTTWDLSGSPYIVTSTVTVPSGITLTIEPGVTVKFNQNLSLNVNGTLNAQGTLASPITFTSNQATPTVGYWYRIYLTGAGSSSSQLSYCTIQYASYGLYLDSSSPTIGSVTASNNSSGLYLDSSSPTISSVTASNNSYGFYLLGSSPSMTAVQAVNNGSLGMYIVGNSSPVITSSTIINNSSYGVYIQASGAVDPNPVIHQSSLYGNGSYEVLLAGAFTNPNAIFNFENNWWGTTDTTTINNKIYDHYDNSAVPNVDYIPFLDAENGTPVPGSFVGGTLTGNTTWTAAQSPFIVYQTVTVPSGITLTIEPGVTVKFNQNLSLTVNGTLNAVGTQAQPITFTSNQATPTAGYWSQVYLNGAGSNASQLSYCTIQYSQYGLYLDSSSPTIGSVTASNNSYGLYLDSSSPTVTQLTVSNNYYGIYIFKGSSPTITDSKIINNSSYGVYIQASGAVDPNPVIHQSSLYGNGSYEVVLGGTFTNPNAIFNFKNNWWGSVDILTINNKIYDHYDYTGFPYVDYIPFLDGPNGNPVPGNYVGGTITQDTTWNAVDGPFIVYQTVTVPSGITLTIEPGVTVKFNSGLSLTVNGTLNAQGTSGSHITFTSNQATPTAGYWSQVYLNGAGSNASQLSYCTIQYSQYGLYLENSSPALLTQLTLSNNYYGLYLQGSSSPTVTNSKMINNSNYGVYIYRSSDPDPNPVIHQSSLYGNGSYEVVLGGTFTNPNAIFNFKNNWWGTTNTQTINSKIYDDYDSSALPLIDYIPFLDGENGNPALIIYDLSVDPPVFDPSLGETIAIHYAISLGAAITINLYDGETHALVRALVASEPRNSGGNSEVWDGRNEAGDIAPAEAYYFTIQASGDAGQNVAFNDPASPLMGPTPATTNASVDASNFNPYQNIPVVIQYSFDVPGRMTIQIWTTGNQVIRNLFNNEVRPAGVNIEYWDGRKDDGTIYTGNFDVYFGVPQAIPLYPLIIKQSPLIVTGSFKTEAYLILPIFSEISVVQYALSREAVVTVEIQDPNGSHFKTLTQSQLQAAGPHAVEWNGKDDSGRVAFVEGVYRVLLTVQDPGGGNVLTQTGTIAVHR